MNGVTPSGPERNTRPPSNSSAPRNTPPSSDPATQDDDIGADEALSLLRDDPPPPAHRNSPPAPGPSSPPPASSPRTPDPAHPASATEALTASAATEASGPTAPTAATDPAAPTATARTAAPHAPTPWPEARRIAAQAAAGRHAPGGREPVRVALDDRALGCVLAQPLAALTDLPPFDTSAMDGWAVAGPGPWEVRAEDALAGREEPRPLEDGEAVRIATGARIPHGATSVLRREHGRTEASGARLHATRDGGQGKDIRPRGQECRSGDRLLPSATVVTPAVLGLAAAAGYDELTVVPRPRAEVLVLGDELLSAGLPRDGLIRDALGPMLPSWLRSLGADVVSVRRLGDDAGALRTAMANSTADVLVTTGGTASGPVDHVHPTLRALGARLLVDGVEVRPGHPMLLARLGQGRHLVGLPGNPLAAVSGLLTLAEPLLRTLSGRVAQEPYTAPLHEAVQGHPHDTRLVPISLREGEAVPLHYSGPAMLRGIAGADAMAVVPPGGGRAGEEVQTLDLPWPVLNDGACFT